MTERPGISKIVLLAVLAACLLPAAEYITKISLAAVLWACGAILGFVALVLTVEYCLAILADYQQARHEIESTTARLREIQAISRLTPDQLALVPRSDNSILVQSAKRTAEGWEKSLWFSTPGGLVPVEFAQEFFQSGGVLNLRPVSSYSEGTFSYEYARNLTAWARSEGLAVGGDGSRSGKAAEWVSPASRALAFDLFNVTWELS